MAANGNDILMRLVLADSAAPLYAECQTEVTTDEDPFVWDYYNGQFFEVKDFTFSMTIDDKDPTEDPVNAAATLPGNATAAGAARPPPTRLTPSDLLRVKSGLKGGGAKELPSGKFMRWKSATAEQIAKMPPYPVRTSEFSITRLYDKASPILFEKCCNSDSFASASLVKRRLIGDKMLRGYLRLDFEDVLVTNVEWENGDTLEEKFKFVFRKLTVNYRVVSFKQHSRIPELRSLDPVEWSYEAELRKKAGK